MSDRIEDILDVVNYVAERYQKGMSEEQVSRFRIEALNDVAKRRAILTSSVSNKYRRELQPAIKGTQAFDRVLFQYLDSRQMTLRLALQQNATASDLERIDAVFGAQFVDTESLEDQISNDLKLLAHENSIEGGRGERLISYFERKPKLRAAAIKIHGTSCLACGFNFETAYGVHGKNYIEVHHIVPISTLEEPSTIDPRHDLAVLCSNCHRMVHRKQDVPLSVDELAKIVAGHR